MRKTLLLAAVLAALGFGLFGYAAGAAELPADDLIECRGGKAPMRLFAECAQCGDPDAQVELPKFTSCVEDKVKDLPIEMQTKIVEWAGKVKLDEDGYVVCPGRKAMGRHFMRPGLAKMAGIYRECAACGGDEPVRLEDFVTCVTEKVAELGLDEDVAARIIEKAAQHPVDEDGNLVCPGKKAKERLEKPKMPAPKKPIRGGGR